MLSRRFLRSLTESIIFDRPLHCSPAHNLPVISRFFKTKSLGSCVDWRCSSSASSTRWKARQSKDSYARDAKVQGLKSRAAFKLLQINDKHKIFKRGNTVVDLGYAPGSWSQVAVNRTSPGGRVVGVDILPAQPPRGASTIQGDFLSPAIQAEVRNYLSDPNRGRPIKRHFLHTPTSDEGPDSEEETTGDGGEALEEYGYIERERQQRAKANDEEQKLQDLLHNKDIEDNGRTVDVVLSDMSEPWELVDSNWKKSVSDPYRRLMNTSGMPFRDHAGSMDLCTAALRFCFDTLRSGGHFVCKFYQGAEDKLLETRIKRLFEKVYREKPAASRSESREGYFVALRRKSGTKAEEIFAE